MKLFQRASTETSPVAELLARLDSLAAGPISNAAQIAKRVRSEGRVSDGVLAGLATAASGPGGGSWLLYDPLLCALNRYSVRTTGRDFSRIGTEEHRRREAQEEVQQRLWKAREDAIQHAEELRVKRVLGAK